MSGRHGTSLAPSNWVRRFASLVPPGPVLDLACGAGRHARLFLELGHPVTAVDIDLGGVADLHAWPDFEAIQADLEGGAPWPLGTRLFAGLVVTNYLHRPLFSSILCAVAAGGLLIYETFAQGNERFGKPRNPEHLLKPGELLEVVHGAFRVLAYEDIEVETPRPAAIQRIAAVKLG